MSVRLIDVIDTANLLDKYDEFPYEYDNRRHQYILTDADFEELRAKIRNKKYLDQFVVDPSSNKSKFHKMSSGSRDTVLSADEYDEVEDAQEIIFTEASLLDLLVQVEELKQYDIGINETIDGNLILQIGESTYELTPKEDIILDVEEDVVDEISDINQEAYEEISESNEVVEEDQTIESGIITETLKTLAIGGLVRLGKKYLDSDVA